MLQESNRAASRITMTRLPSPGILVHLLLENFLCFSVRNNDGSCRCNKVASRYTTPVRKPNLAAHIAAMWTADKFMPGMGCLNKQEHGKKISGMVGKGRRGNPIPFYVTIN
eukprot:TRINITY_DN13653_c0_g3_i1.p1 TRINITY_DN13653_c0_g3~~TRINITY_DN13653_c0_g3_i1.p1  ORF type:complete len:111 (-),score=13.90 TRINITY_DN13653_c0_g3_i1:386-718(-)